MFPRSAAKKQQ